MLKFFLAAVAAVVLTLSTAVTPNVAAAAASNCVPTPEGPKCDIEIGNPGTPGSPGGGGGNGGTVGSPGGFTPGPTKCTYGAEEIPCQSAEGWWMDGEKCTGYVSLLTPQPPPPGGADAGSGAWYVCSTYCPDRPDGCYGGSWWSETPPPGINTYTPAQAAAALVRTFNLTGINIGMAPSSKVHKDDPAGTAPYRRTWVGIPVWLWVADQQPLNYGPYTETATLGGVTVTATARVSSVTWSSEDGQSVTCGAGTTFDLEQHKNKRATDSPTCGFRFTKTSGDGTFTVTATSHWVVEWQGGGTDGTIAVPTASSSTEVRVGELQSVNVPNPDDY